MKILVGGVDPSLANWGMAKQTLDLITMELSTPVLELVRTKPEKGKQVRASSDDLRRCVLLHKGFITFTKDCTVCFAEVPSGAQSARGAISNGVCYGVLAAAPVPVIEVAPRETKLATVGTSVASKEEMIEWAVEAYPDAKWLMAKVKGIIKPVDANEHLADATAIIRAGIKTTQFQQLIALLKAPISQAA